MGIVEFLTEFKSLFSASEGALIGIVVGAAATMLSTSYMNRRIKEVEFRNAYQMKLLERRIAVYDELEDAMKSFFAGVKYHSVMIPRIFIDPLAFREARNGLKLVLHKDRWMTRETQEDLQVFMGNLHTLEPIYHAFESGEISQAEMLYKLIHYTDNLIEYASGILDSSHRDLSDFEKHGLSRFLHYLSKYLWNKTPLHRLREYPFLTGRVYYAPSKILPQILAELEKHPLKGSLEIQEKSEADLMPKPAKQKRLRKKRHLA